MKRGLTPAEAEVFAFAAAVLAKENNVEFEEAFNLIDEIVHQHKTIEKVLPILMAIVERYEAHHGEVKTLH